MTADETARFKEWFNETFGERKDYPGEKEQEWYDACLGKCWMAFDEGLRCARGTEAKDDNG